jgi:hypothetical protein
MKRMSSTTLSPSSARSSADARKTVDEIPLPHRDRATERGDERALRDARHVEVRELGAAKRLGLFLRERRLVDAPGLEARSLGLQRAALLVLLAAAARTHVVATWRGTFAANREPDRNPAGCGLGERVERREPRGLERVVDGLAGLLRGLHERRCERREALVAEPRRRRTEQHGGVGLERVATELPRVRDRRVRRALPAEDIREDQETERLSMARRVRVVEHLGQGRGGPLASGAGERPDVLVGIELREEPSDERRSERRLCRRDRERDHGGDVQAGRGERGLRVLLERLDAESRGQLRHGRPGEGSLLGLRENVDFVSHGGGSLDHRLCACVAHLDVQAEREGSAAVSSASSAGAEAAATGPKSHTSPSPAAIRRAASHRTMGRTARPVPTPRTRPAHTSTR